jgi:hypothetical protein
MVNVKQLIVALQGLSDPEYQRRAWLASKGPVVSSFDEQVCQTFDDTGLSDALDAEKCPPELDEQAFSTLKELDSAVSRVDQSASPERLLKDPRVKEVREIAARALALVAERQT